MKRTTRGFTLVELLIVIGVLVSLSTVIVLVLNPVELFAEARDAQRITDMWTIEKIVMYLDRAQMDSGAPDQIYISQTDQTELCATLPGLPVLTPPWVFACTYGNILATDGTGWLPFNLGNYFNSGALLQTLPVDPKNDTARGLYYTYMTNGLRFEMTTRLESARYQTTMQNDGGYDPNRYERGSDFRLWKEAVGL